MTNKLKEEKKPRMISNLTKYSANENINVGYLHRKI